MLILFDFYAQIIEPLLNGLLKQFLDGMTAGIPKMLTAVILLFVGVTIARFVRRMLNKGLSALGIDKITGRLNDIDLVQSSGMELHLSKIIGQVVYFMIMLMVIMMVVDILNIEVLSNLMKDLFNYLPSALTAAMVLLFGLFLADTMRGITLAACQSLGIPSAKIIAGVVFYFLFISIAVSALGQAKIETTFISNNLTAIIGAGALAFAVGYGLASKDLAANYLASYYNRNKIRVGDEVAIGSDKGKVVLLDNTSMILQTHDRAIIVPLGKLTTEKIEIFYPTPQKDDLLDSGQV